MLRPCATAGPIPFVACALACILLLLLATPPLAGQQFNFRQYTNEEGLPQTQVFSLHQDREGYIWFGTYGGAARYDGTTIQAFTTRDGLLANFVRAIADDPRGRTLFGTFGGGLCFMEEEGVECLTEADGLPSNNVWALHVEDDGTIWAGVSGSLVRIRGDVIESFPFPEGAGSGEILAMAPGVRGTIWIGIGTGLLRFREGSIEPVVAPGLTGNPVSVLIPPTARGPMVAGALGDLYILSDDGGVEPLPVPGGDTLPDEIRLTAGARGPDGVMWFASTNGLVRLDGDGMAVLTSDHGLPEREGRSVMVDREGTVWLGSNGGATKFVPGPFQGYTDHHGLPHATVWAVGLDLEERLWVGTERGVARWDPDEMRFREAIPQRDVPPTPVNAILPLADGGVLIGSGSGLLHWRDGIARNYTPQDGIPDPWVIAFAADGDGAAWIGTRGGIARWEQGGVVPFPPGHPLGELDVITLLNAPDGRLWIGLASGGVRIWDGDTLLTLGADEGLSDQFIWSLSLSATGGMWVGTNGDGAIRVEGDRVVERLTTADGLPNDLVWQVHVDSRERLWMYTSQGLSRYSDGEWNHFRRADGILDLEGSASAVIEAPDGRIWFGSTKGLTVYDPSAEGPVPAAPPVRIQEIALAGEPLPAGASPRFRRGLLQLRFTALTFRDEGAVRFRHRLHRDDRLIEPWSQPLFERTVSFAGLRPGNYTFEVLAIHGTGLESPEPAVVTFTVLPAFWETWWFRLGFLTLLVGALSAVPLLRSRWLEVERRRLEELVGVRTSELVRANEQLRGEMKERARVEEALRESRKMEALGRMAGGIAHDANNLLTAIVCHAKLMEMELEEDHPMWDDLSGMGTACDQLAALVAQLLAVGRRQIAQPTNLSLVDILEEGKRSLLALAGSEVEVEVSCEDDGLGVFIDREHFEQLLMNLCENAVEAMPEGGTLTVRARRERLEALPNAIADSEFTPGWYAVIDVTDTGRGMSEEVASRAIEPFFTTKGVGEGSGLGLSAAYGVARQNGGHLDLRTAPDEGTTVRILLPEVRLRDRAARAGLGL